ncbi:protein-glutamate methylesterase/protein-glutamine glutaminase 2-like isoform X2 [Prinia subflava]|uniref:protein-glutamate methylesterase/protein-glutamine glutaminase 2-like isoform X2 n=1 Tax=Prinia subflava TaxID=208062 RepID=UPI002FE357B9
MKAVDATLIAVTDQAVASGAAAATVLPKLQLPIFAEEAVRDRPEAIAFQHLLRHFMDLYSLAADRVGTLTTGRESLPVHFAPEAAVTPPSPAPAPADILQPQVSPQAARTPSAPAAAPAPATAPAAAPAADASGFTPCTSSCCCCCCCK